MHNVKKKGFTLIELIAVLVIMAILVLISTPLVMSIIRKARISADKRSIDAYGRSIELSIAGYLLDTGKFPTEVSQLTIEYSGNKVECTTTQINPDSSVYLAECKVNNREVSNYSYGSDKKPKIYNVGDIVTYNDIDFYVIKDSGAKEDTVTLLKAKPLTVDEVNLYGGVGTENNHVNMYVPSGDSFYRRARDVNGYGGAVFYSSDTCGSTVGGYVYDGCNVGYDNSDIKYIVDEWASDKFSSEFLINARLITIDEINNNFVFEEYEYETCCPWKTVKGQRISDIFMRDSNYSYWTMSQKEGQISYWSIGQNGNTYTAGITDGSGNVIRPVVELYKSALN